MAPAAASPVPAASDDPNRWGRVDADGTVFVHTTSGERAVGSWQAGTPQDGLAHFAMRFDDLRVEVELLHTRIAGGNGDPKQTLASARALRESLADAAVLGDLEALTARIDSVLAESERALEQHAREREEAKAQANARKEALVTEAEQIAAESTQWKAAGDRLHALLGEWKELSRSKRGAAKPTSAERKADDELWKRLSKAREAFNRRRGGHFAELDKQRAEAKERKQHLVGEAESLVDSQDWGPTAGRFKQLMTDWKAAGRAPKDVDDALWQRFKAAQDTFFARRSETFSKRDAEFAENARGKEELLAHAESRLGTLTGESGGQHAREGKVEAARALLRHLNEEWERLGKVPRDRMKELETRLKTVEDKIRAAADTQWRRSDPEAQARADQFRERVEQFEAQAEKARAAGDTRRAEEAERQARQWREWLTAAEEAVASR